MIKIIIQTGHLLVSFSYEGEGRVPGLCRFLPVPYGSFKVWGSREFIRSVLV